MRNFYTSIEEHDFYFISFEFIFNGLNIFSVTHNQSVEGVSKDDLFNRGF